MLSVAAIRLASHLGDSEMSYKCLQCEAAPARHESLFCSPACRDAFVVTTNGPVRCDYCDNEAETIAEAIAAGWTDIRNTPEGLCWNQQGQCPECQVQPIVAKMVDAGREQV